MSKEKDPLRLGWEVDNVEDLNSLLHTARQLQFDYLIVPLVHPGNERQLIRSHQISHSKLFDADDPLTRSDMVLTPELWNGFVVGKISTWLNFDSTLDKTRRNSRLVRKYAIHKPFN